MSDPRILVGKTGEQIATWWLGEQGLRVLGANVRVDGGEIDLVALDGDVKVAVEIRAITTDGDPIDAIDNRKRTHVQRLASRVGASRVDLVGVAIKPGGLEIHWVPG